MVVENNPVEASFAEFAEAFEAPPDALEQARFVYFAGARDMLAMLTEALKSERPDEIERILREIQTFQGAVFRQCFRSHGSA